MAAPDYDLNDLAQVIKDQLEIADAADGVLHGVGPEGPWVGTPTLHVSDNYVPTDDTPVVLIADDGGPPMFGSPWFINSPRLPLLRFTAFAKGRYVARKLVLAAANWVNNNPGAVGITLVNDVSDPLITRDGATGAYLASITMPTIVRPK